MVIVVRIGQSVNYCPGIQTVISQFLQLQFTTTITLL